MISSISEMYYMAAICLCWAQDSCCVAHRVWLPGHNSTMLCTMAILCTLLSSTILVIPKSFSVFLLFNTGLAAANIPLLPHRNCHSGTILLHVSPVVFDYLQPITSCLRERMASTQILCGRMKTGLCATLERSVYTAYVSSCWHHWSVISSTQNLLLISIGLAL